MPTIPSGPRRQVQSWPALARGVMLLGSVAVVLSWLIQGWWW